MESAQSQFRRLSPGALFVAALLTTSLFHFFGPQPLLGRGGEAVRIAAYLANEGSYASPFGALTTGPTAVAVPLFPLYLAAVFVAFGPHSPVLTVVALLVTALQAPLLPRLSRLLIGDDRPGYRAALLLVLLPLVRVYPVWDANFAAVASMLLCIALSAMAERGLPVLTQGALAGLGSGALILLNPILLCVPAVWLACLVLPRHRELRSLRFLAAGAAGAALIVAPWLLRNVREMGAPVLKSNFGMTFLASNNDCAQPSLLANIGAGCYEIFFPDRNPEQARLLMQMGEVQYDRRCAAIAWRWVADHPASFFRLTAQRIFDFWFPDPGDSRLFAYSTWLVTALSVPGLVLLYRRRRLAALAVVLALAAFSAPYAIVVSDIRYRVPVLWLSLLCAGLTLGARLVDEPPEQAG